MAHRSQHNVLFSFGHLRKLPETI
jgi:hypothetical protein